MIKVDGAITKSLKPFHEFPELFPSVEKLIEKRSLSETDKANLRELVEATGWSVDDVVDDLRNAWRDPLDGVGRYRDVFERYYSDALRLVDRDARRAAGCALLGSRWSLAAYALSSMSFANAPERVVAFLEGVASVSRRFGPELLSVARVLRRLGSGFWSSS